MSDQEKLNEFADDLEAFRDGKIDGETIREKYWAGGLPAQIGKAMLYVEHFLSDEDIREKNDRYREMQEECLRQLVYYLRQGVTAEDLPIITFLGWPKPHKSKLWSCLLWIALLIALAWIASSIFGASRSSVGKAEAHRR